MKTEKHIEQHKHETHVELPCAHRAKKSTTFGGFTIARSLSNSFDLQTLVVFFTISLIASISRIGDHLST